MKINCLQLEDRPAPRRVRYAALDLVKSVNSLSTRPTSDPSNSSLVDPPAVRLGFTISARPGIVREGYRLSIQDGAQPAIDVEATDDAGAFYAVQTLKQMLRHARRIAPGGAPAMLPTGVIEDRPRFPLRGVLHDISRGRVPTLETLKDVVDRLAEWKINQLQLYIEHAFVFAFDPTICSEQHGLTLEEAQELVAYARDRFVALVPAVANLGHMGRILSLPQYSHLAEVRPTRPWSAMSWPERARGFTLDCLHPESRSLVNRIMSEILAAFPSPVINICGDEPWDLGKGPRTSALDPPGRNEAYWQHVSHVAGICRDAGREVQLWADVVHASPDMLTRVPDDLTLLHWGYDDSSDYAFCDTLAAHGATFACCPGTSGWKRIVNAYDLAERNLSGFLDRAGASSGLLMTDWGDHGHFNMLGCGWHPLALAASAGWCAELPSSDEFDRRFARWAGDDALAETVSHLRRATSAGRSFESWRTMWMDADMVGREEVPLQGELADLWSDSRRARQSLDGARVGRHFQDDVAEWQQACEFLSLQAERLAYIRAAILRRPVQEWAEALTAAGVALEQAWRRRHKLSGLPDIMAALAACRAKMLNRTAQVS